MKFVDVDMTRCGCIIRSIHGLPCACELARYDLSSIPLQALYLYLTRLSFNDLGFTYKNKEFFVQQEFDAITKHLKEVDIAGMITIKNKLREITLPNMTSMCPHVDKVKTKGSKKGCVW